jgi:hypothetical protein
VTLVSRWWSRLRTVLALGRRPLVRRDDPPQAPPAIQPSQAGLPPPLHEGALLGADGCVVIEVMLQIAAIRARQEIEACLRAGQPMPDVSQLFGAEMSRLTTVVEAMIECRRRRLEIEQLPPASRAAMAGELKAYIEQHGLGQAR